MIKLSKYSLGVGDRFAQEAEAQLRACVMAQTKGVDVIPVWNKSNREHLIVGSEPPSVYAAAEAAVKKLGWKLPWHVDADHIRLDTVDRFVSTSDFFTIDVADSIGKPAAAADANALTTADQVAAQATRLLADPKAHPAVSQFFSEWMGVDEIANAPKDPTVYPTYTPDVRDAMQQETLAFADWVMWQSDAKLGTLLTAPVSFVNQSLATIYGVSGITGDTLQQVALDPTQRAGIITQAGVMTVLGKADRSSPVLRGEFIRDSLFCQPVAPPPQNIVITPPAVMPGVSTREMFTMHSTVEPCKSCHALMDPIGFGFENYDGIGRWRTTDQGQPVDASGALTGTDIDGTFNGAVDLAHKLAQSGEVRDCVATEWFRYAMGRGESADDACALASLKQSFSASQSDIRQLLVAVTQTVTFRYRNEVTP